MTKSQTITKAQLYLDDMSELSSQEFSDLYDKVYRRVNSDRPWEGTKAEGTGTTSTTLPYIALASGFLYLTQNANYTDSSELASNPVVFRGSTYKPYKVISWSDRRQYRNVEGYAYIDFLNLRLYFTNQPTVAEAVEYDYHAQKTALGDSDSPWFPAEFHDVLYHLMVADDYVIQQSDKSKSYRDENIEIANDYLERMNYWNSELVQL
jgi:hypothetical protein